MFSQEDLPYGQMMSDYVNFEKVVEYTCVL